MKDFLHILVTIAFAAAQSKCCGELTDVKIPVKKVTSYYWTSSSCPRRTIVFIVLQSNCCGEITDVKIPLKWVHLTTGPASSVPHELLSVISIDSAQSKCCGEEFTDVKIPVKLVTSYYWTSSSCARRAIVFQTKAGREFCVDPETPWVNGHIAKVDKRTTV
ncbi:hypothetical protein cypCar_00025406 [Cyprinus carpio]|nr:hypothetical protein cypCar_00025406 [Cyprinus carpio]